MFTREEKLEKLASRHLNLKKEVKYEEIGDFIDDEYVDLYIQCAEQYGCQEYLELSVYKVNHGDVGSRYPMFALRDGMDDTNEFYEYIENNDTPFTWVGDFVYRLQYSDEDKEYEYELEFSQYA